MITNTALFSQVEAKGKQKAKELGKAGEYERCGGGQGKDAQEVMEGGVSVRAVQASMGYTMLCLKIIKNNDKIYSMK